MDVYLLPNPLAEGSPEYQFWRPPQLLCFRGNSPAGVNVVTAGGLIRDANNTIYMVIVDDLSLLGWSFCHSSSSSSSTSSTSTSTSSSSKPKHHRRCTPVQKLVQYHYDLSQTPVGIIGQLVHFSLEHGYGLVRVNPEWYAGADQGAAMHAAIPADRLAHYVDQAHRMDLVEFTTADGEEVTGVVAGMQEFCLEVPGEDGPRRRTIRALVVNTSSYSVKPEDCGVWVRRTVASERHMLLGQVVGFSEGDGYSMLVLPFEHFRDDLRRVVRGSGFNLVRRRVY